MSTWLADLRLPPAECAIHPTDIDFSQTHGGEKLLSAVLYPMRDDLKAEIALVQRVNVRCTEIQEARWASSTTIPLPADARLACTSQGTRGR
jgi:hypothetical protein